MDRRGAGRLQTRRAPYGARGLKLQRQPAGLLPRLSRPVRGAWIEIPLEPEALADDTGRAPYGARGLKFQQRDERGDPLSSRPVRGAWIEICHPAGRKRGILSRPVRGAWIEICYRR